jgi:hypothetical protein
MAAPAIMVGQERRTSVIKGAKKLSVIVKIENRHREAPHPK